MKYPSITGLRSYSVNLPDLFGGLNLRDESKRADNQLSDCLNVWQKDGLLQTRPGFYTNEQMKKNVPAGTRLKKAKIKVFPEIKNGDSVLVSAAIKKKKASGKFSQIVFFIWQDKSASNSYTLGGPATQLEDENGHIDYFVLQKDEILYAFYADGTLQKVSIAADNASEWENVSLSDTYIPTVYTHCKAASDTIYQGTMLEGFNLICDKFKMIYSTVNRERITANNPTLQMIYPLPKYNPGNVNGKKITIKITSISGSTYTHEAEFIENVAEETVLGGDGLRFKAVAGTNITFYNNTGSTPTIATLGESDFVEDNMEITVPRELTGEDKNKVFKMRRSCYFGGAAGGIKGGTRIFLCGNEGSERALVLWSGLNNPLYYNENCFFYAGNKAYGVTAFGKQNDKLVIFKENEIYYTYYAENSNITEEDLINQSVMDYESAAVYFPLVSLSGYIGCDAPDTVQLCRNGLVWANSSGHVYTLATLNQYSELDVYPVSEMVDNKLTNYKNQISEAVSVDLDGHYALIIGSTVFLFDYNSYGFRYITSYSKQEDANAKIPWHIWELPENGQKSALSGCIAAVNFKHTAGASNANIYVSILNPEREENTDGYYSADGVITKSEIKSLIATNFFDFGAIELNKRIIEANIAFADNEGTEMLFEAENETGIVYSERFGVLSTVNDKNAVGNIKNIIFRNIAPLASKICLRISSIGRIAVSSANIKYKFVGGAK